MKESEMDKTYPLDHKFETIAWGALLIWWGLRWWPLEFLPNGVGLFGSGLILFSLNAIRWLNGIPSKSLTTILGILAFAFGGLLWAGDVLQLSLEIPLFEVFLISLGIFLLVRELLQVRKTDIGKSH